MSRHADPADRARRLPSRFWAKVDRQGDDDCWPWMGSRLPEGYGTFWRDGRIIYAHRMAWELQNGPIPVGLQIDHRCYNTWCVNVRHMEVVTMLENIRRRRRAGRHKRIA